MLPKDADSAATLGPAALSRTKNMRWQTSAPHELGLDAATLDAARETLATKGTKALLVARRGKIAYEWYADDHGPDVRHYTASMAKALVGGVSLMLALNDGKLQIDDPARLYVPAWRDDPLKSRVTIRHLATHSSGVEDAEQDDLPHDQLPGWKGAFWRQDPDPFTLSRDDAPVVFEPGSRYAYSNPGMAMLSYCVTAAMGQDIRTLLRERVMQPLGVEDEAWSVGYGRTDDVDGLPLVGNWGGGGYTARATAAVGQWMLQRGERDGRQLVAPEWVDRAVAYAGTPTPDRPAGNPQPTSGLGWWTNRDGVWPNVPRDAYAGAGAGNQVLLVVPSLDLVVVRNGGLIGSEAEGLGFWGGIERFLFDPVMSAVSDEPVAISHGPKVVGIDWAPEGDILRLAKGVNRDGSDNWPLAWGQDDSLYTAYGDGYGFDPPVPSKLGLGFARIEGDPPNLTAENIRSDGENTGMGRRGRKASGLVSAQGALYMLARNADDDGHGSQLARSADGAQTWEWADWRFEEFGYPTFVDFGRDYAGVPEHLAGFVYFVSHDGPGAYEPADSFILARAPLGRLMDRASYEVYAGLDGGKVLWTGAASLRSPVLGRPSRCLRSGISYNAGLARYLWWQQIPDGGEDTRFEGGMVVCEAPEPWGPWTVAYGTTVWEVGPGEHASFPTKWMDADGRRCRLVFSGDDNFSVRGARLLTTP